MNTRGTINLLRKTESEKEQLSPSERKFRTISTAITVFILSLAALTAGITVVLRLQQRSLENTREKVRNSIAAQSSKEVMYHALVERISIVSGIFDGMSAWDRRYDLVNEMADPPILKRFYGTTDSEMKIDFQVATFEEVVTLAGLVNSFFMRSDITNPRVVSYSFNTSDGISLTLGFRPVF